MATYTEAAEAVRQARAARDAARDAHHLLKSRGIGLAKAKARAARGEGVRDPETDGSLRPLRAQIAAALKRAKTLEARRAEIARMDLVTVVEKLEARIAAEREAHAALDRELTGLASLLAHSPEANREALQEKIRMTQTRRAAMATDRQRDDSDLATARGLQYEAAALAEESSDLAAHTKSLRTELKNAERRAADFDLAAAERRQKADLETARQTKSRRDAELKGAIGKLYGDVGPLELLGSWDDSLPIALLPLRIETRWKTDLATGAQLWVRVYPDDIGIHTHEPLLTAPELEYGQAYWIAVRAAAEDGEAQEAAWTALAARFGGNRAAWVARRTRPLNWDAVSADPDLALDFPVQDTKPSAWTDAPHSRVLPDRFMLMAWRGADQRIFEVGAPVDDVVVLGPAPIDVSGDDASIERDLADNALKFGDAFEWVRNFPRAVDAGLGFRVDVSADDVTLGFDRLLVLGLKLSADAPEAKELLETLIDNHHYSRAGFGLLRQGTPTNNTDGGASGYTRAAETGVAGAGPERFTPVDDRNIATDGQRFADLLGIGYGALLHAGGADNTDHLEAVAMNRALYAGTLGYYFDQMLNEVVSDASRATLRRHFTDLVTGRGPMAAIRIGNQPYGFLPTSSLARWQSTEKNPFERTLVEVLRSFDTAWTSKLGQVAQLGGAGGAENLLKVLGLQPASCEFYQRVGYSYDYLRNLESFAWGGSDADEVIKMALEGATARGLLRSLGYSSARANGSPKPSPHLLQLIWRHYHTALDGRQLIDGMPYSETANIKPYGTSESNYIDWLLANAGNATALEVQDFGGAARPGAMLYLMLHFSLVMEASRAIFDFLEAHAIQADELVRSRKFLNVSSPSPSTWEVFRAPANKIVAQSATPQPLLTLVHTPQLAAGAGARLAEQKAALEILAKLPTARLERALVEHVDTLSYRLDAWTTSLFTRRLARQRKFDGPVRQRRDGVYLGAYGYLEKVKPDLKRERGNGGYVHAPSLNHATAAALLRSGYLTHASPADPQALAVNLSSGRVARARYLIEGIRNGQTLETLLGVQFERGLHDWTTHSPNPVILDQLKPAFRAAFPIVRTRVPQAADTASGASEVHEDHQVTNGLTLARSKKPYPYDIADLAGLSNAQRDAIVTEKASIENTLDALRDVLTAESAYQLALGNFDRAAAVLQSVGNGTLPPDIEVINTPRGTTLAFTQRLAVSLDASVTANPWAPIALTERSRLEPALNAWLGDMLGDPTMIRCRVAAVDAAGAVLVDGGGPIEETVSVAQLDLQPIDFIYAVRPRAEASGAAELETRVRHVFATARNLGDEVIVRIAFAAAGGGGARSFAEALPLADRLRRVLGTAKALDARHFASASHDPVIPDPANAGGVDVAEVHARVTTRLAAVAGVLGNLGAAVNAARASTVAADIGALRGALVAVARTGFAFAMPRSMTGTGTAHRDVLVAQADALIARATTLGDATNKQLADAAAAANPDMAIERLTATVKGWMGGDMILLPRFAYGDAAAVQNADGARAALVAYAKTQGSPLPVQEWLHGAACVRPLVHDFEIVRAIADANRVDPLALDVLQLPFRGGDSWLGARFPSSMEVLHDTVSMVQHLPQGFSAAGAQVGLLIDEWTESVPAREEVTGLTFNYNAPNSAPPQAVLLAITPHETGRWAWDDLVDTVLDTFRRAKLRAVEPDMLGDIPGIGTLLPAVVAEFSTSAASVSLDYSLVMSEIRIPVMQMQGIAKTPGGG